MDERDQSIPVTMNARLQGENTDSLSSNASRPSSLSRLAILAGLLIPITFVPYLLNRRQVHGLRREVDRLTSRNKALQVELNVERIQQGRIAKEIEELRQVGKQREQAYQLLERSIRHDMLSTSDLLRCVPVARLTGSTYTEGCSDIITVCTGTSPKH
jgi:ABC-type phosphate transport system auxiliary subunit